MATYPAHLSTSWDTPLKTYIDAGDGFTPEQYGAVGDGVANDTTPVLAAFAAANALRRTVGTYSNPGARVVMTGYYKMSTLAAPIPVMCHLDAAGAEILAPSGYTGTVMEIGHATSGSVLQNAEISAPSVTGVTVASMASLPVGSIGITIRNLYTSRVRVGKITYFETALRVGGQSWGVAYNEIGFRTISFSKVCLKVGGLDASGWANQNTFIAGAITGDSTWAGGRRATGARACLLDGTGSNTVTGNVFLGSAFESDTFEHAIEVKNGYQNQWFGCRHEQGVAATSVTVSGATFTATAHPLAVDDMVIISGTTAPPEISFDRPYYVTATTANTFQVALAKGGTAIVCTTAGVGVTFSRPQRVRFESSYDNTIYHPFGPLVWLEKIEATAGAGGAGNMIRYAGQGETRDSYMSQSWPIHRARNRASSGGAAYPLWAAYPAAKDPYTDPASWTAALGDTGLFLGAGGASGTVQASSGGVLRWVRPADTSAFELASCQRTQSARVLSSGTAYTAGRTTGATITLTGALVGDYVEVASLSGLLPFGLYVHAEVTATDTITYVIDNLTAGTITLGANFSLFFMATRRFF
jgi:hypothetical protein